MPEEKSNLKFLQNSKSFILCSSPDVITIIYYYSFLFSIISKMSISTSRVFQNNWLLEEEFKGWLRKAKDEKTKYRCIVCNKKLFLSTSGRCALSEHGLENKLIKMLKKGAISLSL